MKMEKTPRVPQSVPPRTPQADHQPLLQRLVDASPRQQAQRDQLAQLQGGARAGGPGGYALQLRTGQQARPTMAPGRVVQCVGGEKFGLRKTGGNDPDVQEGIERLKAVQATYKLEIKTAKQAAARKFSQDIETDSEDQEKKLAHQKAYSEALALAELDPDELLARLGGDFSSAKDNGADVISYKGKEIARLERGNAAYAQHAAADALTGTAAIYKRHTLDGPSQQDYVAVGGSMLRRYAYRGITPPERAAYKANTPLLPVNLGHTGDEMGYNYNENTGVPEARVRDEADGKIGDIEWLRKKTGSNIANVANPNLLAFMQTRKGTGKLLSATSTKKPITSNHNKTFTGFGSIKIDLAKVPQANITHHYKQPDFDADQLSARAGKHGKTYDELKWETERANETVLRNRELLLTGIPHTAVTELQDTEARQQYEHAFPLRYRSYFQAAFQQAVQLAEQGGLILPYWITPEPAAYPAAPQDHFGEGQADIDAKAAGASAAGKAIAELALEKAWAYRKAYQQAWTSAYYSAALDALYDPEPTDKELSTVDKLSQKLKTPDAPDPKIPEEMDATEAELQGAAHGAESGRTRGSTLRSEMGTPTATAKQKPKKPVKVVKDKKSGGATQKGGKQKK